MRMERLNVKTLLLELTRNCNLECKHCFRGDSQNVYMNLNIIDYVFKNVCRINEFLLIKDYFYNNFYELNKYEPHRI